MQSIKEFVKTYYHLTSVETSIVHKDSEGKIYSSNEEAYKAIKAGKDVKLININESALDDLRNMGIESKSDATKFIELLNYLHGGPKKTKSRRNYSDAEKAKVVKAWAAADKAGTSKVDFCKENNITYQTLMKWIKEVK
ncbi:hypothetical protein [Negadavirga shengliensis]|uniref:Transposase n=1 Tax=Negadavirga shengliensis TaxID=1389218 RepID=A0ABV9T0D3_9BACT